MITKELAVKVTASGYIDIIESNDPAVCARVLALLLENAKPETAEQRLVRELEARVEAAESNKYTQQSTIAKLEKQVADLTKAVNDTKVLQGLTPT